MASIAPAQWRGPSAIYRAGGMPSSSRSAYSCASSLSGRPHRDSASLRHAKAGHAGLHADSIALPERIDRRWGPTPGGVVRPVVLVLDNGPIHTLVHGSQVWAHCALP